MAKNRTVQGNRVKDVAQITNEQYNQIAGAQKQMDVGAKLLAVPVSTNVNGTTDVSGGTALPSLGRSVAIYNNSGTVGAVAFGQVLITAPPVAGTVASDGTVGIPCAPNAWTYLSAGDAQFIRTSSANLYTFLIADDTTLAN